jgi:hypothetical protein
VHPGERATEPPCRGFHRFDEELCRLGAGYVTVMAIVVAGEPPGHVHAM